MTTRRTTPGDAELAGLAGEVRTEISRLAYHLRTPATRSGITPTRLAALSALAFHRGGMRQGELADLMGVSAPSMTRLVEVLCEAGWIERTRDPEDQRALLIVLSAVGEKTLETLRSESASALSAELAELDDDERVALAAAVPVLRKLADRHLDAVPARD